MAAPKWAMAQVFSGVGLNATWELDLWGRVRYGRAATTALAGSALADFEYARQSIAALVAKSWFLATEAGLQVEAARESIRANEELVRLAGDRLRIGVGGQEDVFVARATVGGYRDALRQLELGREQAIRALEILLGRYPSAAAAITPRLPGFPGEVPAGLPSELLERRPDVVAAERRVAAAFNRIGEAKAARLPAIALTTGVSSITSDLFVLKDHSNPVWSLGANLLAPIYRGGALKTQVEIRTAEQKQAIAEYAAVGLRAFGEVEGALAAEIAAREREQILTQALSDNQQALTVVQTQFKVGQHRSQVRRAADSGAGSDPLSTHPRAGRTARATRESPPRARWQLRAAAPGANHTAAGRHRTAFALRPAGSEHPCS